MTRNEQKLSPVWSVEYLFKKFQKTTNRSRNVISGFLRDTENYRNNMKSRSTIAISLADKRAILRHALISHYFAAKSRKQLA